MDYGVSVAFGRNVGSVPMLDVEWGSFQTDVLGVLRDELAYLARIFCQDAICLTVGNDYLVEGD